MSVDTGIQPDGTPTWIDLGVPDLDLALDFYGALFGWEFDVGPVDDMIYGRLATITNPFGAEPSIIARPA